MAEVKRRLRMGMVGGGQGAFIGGVHRIAARIDDEVELIAGCFSRDPANSAKTGAELRLDPDRVYDTYGEMAKREAERSLGDRIDFVSIVTPNSSHAAVATAFLEAGVHVVCDKPMTFSVGEAEELVKLVEKTGLVFVLSHNYTGNAVVREARERFQKGEMGQLRKVLVEYVQDFLAYPHEKEGMKQAVWRVDPKQAGLGGALGDVGTHSANLLEYVTCERITELCADTSTFLPDRTLDEDANILIRLSGGGKGVISVSQIATGEENALRLRAYAADGAVVWDQENPNYLGYYRFDKPRQTITRAAKYMSKSSGAVTRVPTGHPEGYLEAFATIYRDTVSLIRSHTDGNPVPPRDYLVPSVYDGLRGMQFVTAAVESAAKGSVWVKLP
ncbi:MAG: Gfo/Idh/MocA family oxidoreductase [Spirochaetales bacterium]|nr:Gfo/Idh/MocA family oxidoreductase [Spirochaetales bacterium]